MDDNFNDDDNDDNNSRSVRPGWLTKKNSSSSVYYSSQNIDAITEEYMKKDKNKSKTWTRRFVEEVLMKKAWYFPGKDIIDGPQLSKAYAYYEHFTLVRHFNRDDEDQNSNTDARRSSLTGSVREYERSGPGELTKPTKLYSPFCAESSTLGEFGIGVATYFTKLRLLSLVLFVTGLINLPNILYYDSNAYNNKNNGNNTITSFLTRGSALCDTTEWVPCDGCERKDFEGKFKEEDGTITIERYTCPFPDLGYGLVNFGSFIFLLLCFFLMDKYEKQREIRFDERKQTAQDYSVVVNNPPPDAYEPEVWRTYFSKFAEDKKKGVTSISVILNNHQLLRKLTYRRLWRQQLLRFLPKAKGDNAIDLNDENIVRYHVSMYLKEQEGSKNGFCCNLWSCIFMPLMNTFGYYLPPEKLVDNIFAANEEIEQLLEQKYDVVKVFATFETEASQRHVLEILKTSARMVRVNATEKVSTERALFQGNVLHVVEAPEPDTVRWLDLHSSVSTRYIQRLVTFLITIAMVVVAGVLIGEVRKKFDSEVSAYLTIFFNFLVPLLVKLIMLFESHANEATYQTSLFLKITLFRWANTALVTMFSTPFTSTISSDDRDIIVTIFNILLAELWLTPLLQLLDIYTNIGKHYFAPREKTQENMNLWFQGTYYNLGERYTDYSKIVFVVFLYSAVFPTGFFYGAAILTVQYYTDKFCLMRIWKRAPFMGSDLARSSRQYVIPLSMLGFLLSASNMYAQFPYSHICEDPDNKKNVYCTQGNWVFAKLFREGYPGFPAVSSVLQSEGTWMTDDQITLTNIYGWSTVVFLVFLGISVFRRSILYVIASMCSTGKYEPEGQDAQIDFQNVSEISIYVPQMFWDGLQFPVLACDIRSINKEWIDWKDPSDSSYDKHNMIFDFKSHERIRKQLNYYQNNNSLTSFVEVENVTSSKSFGIEIGQDQITTSHDVEVKSGSSMEFSPVFSIVKSWSRIQGNNDIGVNEELISAVCH